MIPRGFCGLTSMRRLHGFRAHMDGDWCSLDELGPLSQLKLLKVIQLESVSSASFAAKARLGEKIHLIDLFLHCTSKLGDYWFGKEYEGISQAEQQRIEEVFDELCPPPSVENLHIEGYFGRQLPSWMMSTLTVPLHNLKTLYFSDLACCTQLPNGLCQLPYLHLLQVCNAPCIRRVESGFLQAAATPFPRLKNLSLIGLVEWEEWEWEDQVEVMPHLDELFLCNCRRRRVPLGLASNARALKKLIIQDIQHLCYLENFPLIVDLTLLGSRLGEDHQFPKSAEAYHHRLPKVECAGECPCAQYVGP
uniref:R13L1/DRL21-like LRR repeat region domain-containing protein n=1 Tax=Triticum urartu TaxID=4572 RepID=A0A8R7VCV6_TRIUA